MVPIYADEDVPGPLIEILLALGLDVLTAGADGRAGRGIGDPSVLARAHALGRTVLTKNRDDYHALHRTSPDHSGIVTHTQDDDYPALAARVHAAVADGTSLAGRLIKITKPNPSEVK